MTALLVSVRNRAEAELARQARADIIDLKEPTAGSLGAAPSSVALEIAQHLAHLACLSLAMGELRDWDQERLADWPLESFQFAKIGLAGMRDCQGWLEAWHAWRIALPKSTAAVAVAYVDADRANSPTLEQVVRECRYDTFRYLLLDTFDKRSGCLTDFVTLERLRTLHSRMSDRAVTLAVAGRLTCEHVPPLVELGIPIIAVRGAACWRDRESELSGDRLGELLRLVRRPAGTLFTDPNGPLPLGS